MTRVYLDSASSAPLHPEAGRAMMAFLQEGRTGNAASIHHDGRAAEALVSGARIHVADMLGARPAEIVFTSSGTEANNLAVRGAADALRAAGRGTHIIATCLEHESVLAPIRELESRGFSITFLRVSAKGSLDLAELEAAFSPSTILASVMWANHETGMLFPIRQIAEMCNRRGVLFHCDASMAIGRISVSVEKLGVDLLSLSGHKWGGPPGTGALFVRRGVKLTGQMLGGPQERKRRAGAENIIGIVGMGTAAAHMEVSHQGEHLSRLTARLYSGILDAIPDVYLNSTLDGCPGILNVSFDGVEGQSLLMALDLAGVSVASGTPCSSGSLEPSPVLLELGLGEERARQSVRFSPWSTTTEAEIDVVLDLLPAIVRRLRGIGRVARRT